MIDAIKQFFDQRIDAERHPSGPSDHALRLATAALLMEMSRADHDVSAAERETVNRVVRETFDLDAEETAELIRLAEGEARDATCLFRFTSLINEGFSYEDKLRIMELLWQVAYADAELEKHEHHLMRRLVNLLHISHKDYIAAKFRARQAVGAE